MLGSYSRALGERRSDDVIHTPVAVRRTVTYRSPLPAPIAARWVDGACGALSRPEPAPARAGPGGAAAGHAAESRAGRRDPPTASTIGTYSRPSPGAVAVERVSAKPARRVSRGGRARPGRARARCQRAGGDPGAGAALGRWGGPGAPGG